MVSSSKSEEILNKGAIITLVNRLSCDCLLRGRSARGGGGRWPKYGLSAVILTNLASSLLALKLKADVFVISTYLEQVAVPFGT